MTQLLLVNIVVTNFFNSHLVILALKHFCTCATGAVVLLNACIVLSQIFIFTCGYFIAFTTHL